MKFLTSRMTITRKFLLPVLALFAIQACGDNSTGTDDPFSEVPPPYDTTQAVSKTTTDDGLTIYTIEEGFGSFEVTSQDQIRVKFTGRTADGEIFDTSFRVNTREFVTFQNLTPVAINASGGRIGPLIDGFRRGVLGMKEGEKRTIVVPPELGYGESQEGTNGFNLRNDTLIFDVMLLNIVAP